MLFWPHSAAVCRISINKQWFQQTVLKTCWPSPSARVLLSFNLIAVIKLHLVRGHTHSHAQAHTPSKNTCSDLLQSQHDSPAGTHSWNALQSSLILGVFTQWWRGVNSYIYSCFPVKKKNNKRQTANQKVVGGVMNGSMIWQHYKNKCCVKNSTVPVEISHNGNTTITIPNQNGA